MNILTALIEAGNRVAPMQLLFVSALLGLAASASHADSDLLSDSPPSCYQSVGLESPAEAVIDREIVIALDQTTVLTNKLIELLRKTVQTLVVPGSRISVVTFSAYSSHHHLHNELTLEIELPPSPERKLKIPSIKSSALKNCLARQGIASKRILGDVVKTSLQNASLKIARSEIISAMRTLGPRLVEFQGTRILLMVSDGLEHSPGVTTSFYEDQQLRRIESAKECADMKAQQRLANLAGVRVYFFGGAISPDQDVYRDDLAVSAIETFWMCYIAASGGTLVEFGKPGLLSRRIQ